MSLQADGADVPVVNGHDAVSVTDASTARGGDEVAQTRSRQSSHMSATASVTGNTRLT